MRGWAANDWLVWQLADSAFPTGGFAHSGGVEAAWQHGELDERDSLATFLEAALAQAGSGGVPFVLAAVDGTEPITDLDALCDAFTSNHVANRASRLQGRAFLNSAERAFHNASISTLRTELAESPGHFAPVFGAVARCVGLRRGVVSRLFLFIQLRGCVGSAVRLGAVGPIEAQAIQARLTEFAERTAARCENLTIEDVSQTAPFIDLYQGTQDRLYSRLFQS
jgi:urease accessory protein